MKYKYKVKNVLIFELFLILIISFIFHLIFSKYGFSLADDGYVLAQSRRILEGQVPHRDFIWVRPVLSAFIHVPLVLLGGEYTFWLSRFVVWFQYALVSWIWIKIVEVFLIKTFSLKEKSFYFLLAFIFNVNNNWLIINQTLDAVFLSSLGIYFCVCKKSFSKFLGYFLLGCAVLTRQNFLLVGILTSFILKDFKCLKYWIGFVLPIYLCGVYLYINNGLNDAIIQIGAQSKIFPFWPKFGYFNIYSLGGIFIGILSGFINKSNFKIKLYLQFCLICFIFVFLLFQLSLNNYMERGSFFVFMLLVSTIFFVKNKNFQKLSILALFISWAASIAYGIPYPVYLSGSIFMLVLFYLRDNIIVKYYRVFYIGCLMILFCSLGVFSYARYMFNYKDLSSNKLTNKLDNVFNGAKLIYTSSNTFLLIEDLKEAIRRCGESKYFILEWFQGYWVKSKQENLLNSDLPVNTELPIQYLVSRVVDRLYRERGKSLIIIPKVGSILSAKGLVKLSEKDYPYGPIGTNLALYYSEVSRYVLKNFNKAGETKYFLIYR